MAKSNFTFEIRLKDPDSDKLKAMPEGIRAHFSDASMSVTEAKVMIVNTDNEQVAALLKLLNTNGMAPKRRAKRKEAVPEEA